MKHEMKQLTPFLRNWPKYQFSYTSISKHIHTRTPFNVEGLGVLPQKNLKIYFFKWCILGHSRTKECVALSIDICSWSNPVKVDILTSLLTMITFLLYAMENQIQHMKLYQCSYITQSKLQHILQSFNQAILTISASLVF